MHELSTTLQAAYLYSLNSSAPASSVQLPLGPLDSVSSHSLLALLLQLLLALCYSLLQQHSADDSDSDCEVELSSAWEWRVVN